MPSIMSSGDCTDGCGRSDTREALRRFFEVDAIAIVVSTLKALADEGSLPAAAAAQAIERYGVDPAAGNPWER